MLITIIFEFTQEKQNNDVTVLMLDSVSTEKTIRCIRAHGVRRIDRNGPVR
jgi:hypothetical protein